MAAHEVASVRVTRYGDDDHLIGVECTCGEVVEVTAKDVLDGHEPIPPTNPCAKCGNEIYLSDTCVATMLGDEVTYFHEFCAPAQDRPGRADP